MLNSEAMIQQECYIWFNNKYCLSKHEPRCHIFSVPNEGENAWEVQKKKNIGLVSGVSDLILLLPGRALFMECKTPVGTQSATQIEFEKRVTQLGYKYHIFKSLDQFQQILKTYITWQKES